jgi:hypothetical protein
MRRCAVSAQTFEFLIVCGFVCLMGVFLIASYLLREKSELFRVVVTLCVWTTPPFFPRTEKRALSLGLMVLVIGLMGLIAVLYAEKYRIVPITQ